jgi:hypothetical protein
VLEFLEKAGKLIVYLGGGGGGKFWGIRQKQHDEADKNFFKKIKKVL